MGEYDTLKIKIEADSKQANASIKTLSANLQKLDNTAKEIDTARVETIKGLLQDIANIDFSNVVAGLEGVVNAFKSLGKLSSNDKGGGVAKTGGANLQVPPKGTGNELFVGDMSKYGALELPSTTLTSFADLKQSWIQIYDLSKKTNKEFNYTTKEVKKLGDTAKNTSTNGLKKLLNQFAKIVRYRIIRKIIQEIYKALTEGIKNVTAFDQATSDAVDKISGKFEFLKNSIGSMIAPLIQVVEPILTELMQVAGELGNSFAEIFAGANGQTTFAKAKDDVEGLNKEAKKLQSLGIDELNILSSDDSSGMFSEEQVNLGGEMGELASTLKDVFGEIKDLFSEVFDIAKQFVSKVLPAISKLLKPVLQIVGVIIDLVQTLLDDTFEDVNDSLVDFVEMVGDIFNFIAVITKDFAPTLKQLVHQISDVLNIINSVLSIIFEGLGGSFNILSSVIHVINVVLLPVLNVIMAVITTISKMITAVVETIKALMTGNLLAIKDIWQDTFNDIGKSWTDMALGNAKIYGYANGGFPEDGFFYANHNELVGQFSNGQTAVANNEQITEGIYQAVKQAMNESGNQKVVIELDSHVLAEAVANQQKNTGASLLLGGNINFGE